ncbi:MAG: hypothetical protein K2H12_04025, partial [Acetatifactor sp.]|nr:hypothetical protein [Acetatifactor sp.]
LQPLQNGYALCSIIVCLCHTIKLPLFHISISAKNTHKIPPRRFCAFSLASVIFCHKYYSIDFVAMEEKTTISALNILIMQEILQPSNGGRISYVT